MPESPSSMPFVVNHREQRVFFDPDDERGRRLQSSGGNFNPLSLRLWEQAIRLQEWDAIVDIGCNYGEMVLGVDMPAGSDVIAYEPNRKILPYLKKSLSGLDPEVELIEQGIADVASDSTDFAVDTEWSGTSTLAVSQAQSEAHGNITIDKIQTTTLDANLGGRGYRSMCVKIDVEGYEFEVLAGAASLLDELVSWAVMIEILHMKPEQVTALAQRRSMYLLDARTGDLVHIPGEDPALTEEILASGWLYPQDALLVNPDVAARLTTDGESSTIAAQLNRAIAAREQELVGLAETGTSDHADWDDERQRLTAEIESFRSSTSWRSTAWLRALSGLVRRRSS